MFCKNCGADMKDSQTCPVCGVKEPASSTAQSDNNSLQANVSGMLSYLLGWLSGIIFFLVDRRPSVRFHAMQSIVTFGGLSILTFIYNKIISIFPLFLWRLFYGINTLISLGTLVLAIFLMVQAYKGKQYRLPFVAPYVDQIINKIKF